VDCRDKRDDSIILKEDRGGGDQNIVIRDVQKKNSTYELDRGLIVHGENGKLAVSSLDF
jgi:hypothetical protein